MSRRPISVLLGAFFALCSLAAVEPAADAIARLRVEVDDLAEQVHTERATRRTQLAALQAERADLERRVRAARARKVALGRIEADATARAEAAEQEALRWREPARAAVAVARQHVAEGLPFATAQRLQTLDRLEADLNSPAPDVARVVERLWRFMEEEASMGGEVSLGRQTIAFADQPPQLVEVLRLGMALLYVRTLDGQIGWARRTADGWRFETLDDPDATQVVQTLFDAHEVHVALGPAELLIPPEAHDG